MKFSTWWLYCLVISVSATTVCMEQVAPLPIENLVALLPKLTVLDPTYRSLGLFEPSFGYANKQQSYQQAFSYLNKEDALACLATPQIFSRQVIKDGKSIERISKHTFALANLAQGLLFLQQGKAVRAQLEFNLAKDRVGYKSHETPVKDAALAALALTNNKRGEAFSHIKKLVHTPYNPVWQELGAEQMRMLAAQGYLPAKDAIKAHDALKEKTQEQAAQMLQLLAQPENKNFTDCALLQRKRIVGHLRNLSEDGNCAASNLLARVAFEKAVEGKNLYGKKIDKRQALQEVKPFAQNAGSWQEQKPYHDALTQFLDGAIACEKKEWGIASESLVAFVQQKTEDNEIKALQKKAVDLLDALVGQNDWRARCWSAATQLHQETKKKRCQGIIASGQLLSFVMQNSPGTVNESLLHEFGIVETLDGITGANQTVACSMLAPWACEKAIEEQDIFGNNVTRQQAWEQAQKYLKSAQLKKKDKQLKLLGQFVNAVMTHEHETASKLFGTVVNDKNIKGLPKSVLEYAKDQVKQFALKGDIKAQACHAHQLLGHQDKGKREQGVALCCNLMEKLLSGKIEKKQIDVSQLSADLGTIAKTGNAHSCYLLSRYKFRQLHKDCEQTGLSVDQDQNLLAVFKLAGTASKNGCKQAKEFAKALMLYRGSLGFIKKKQYDAAVEQLSCLYNYQSLPEIEQAFCQSFAFDQLSKLAYQHGNAYAQCWRLQALLISSNAEDMGQVFEVGRRLFMSAITKIDKKKLQAIKEYKLIETLQGCVDALEDGQIKAEGHCLLMQWYAMQANPQLSKDPGPFLQKALSFGKQALELCDDEHKSSYKKKIGNVYHSLACVSMDKKEMALEYLREGSALQNPACMCKLAFTTLEADKMSKEMFDAQIVNIKKAYKLGNEQAGNFLAQCYFDGRNYTLPSGRSLPQDRQKAFEIALSLPLASSSPTSKRIISYMKFYHEVAQFAKKKNQSLFDTPISLMMQAAQSGDDNAFGYLVEMYTTEQVSEEQRNKIATFIAKKTAQDNWTAMTMCALGSIFLYNEEVEDAIGRYTLAVARDDGILGNYKLAMLYSDNAHDCKDISQATEYCMKMLAGIPTPVRVSNEHGGLILQVTGALQEEIAKGSQKATDLYEKLCAKCEKLGMSIKVNKVQEKKLVTYDKQAILEEFEMLKPKGPATVISLIALCMEHDIYPEAIINYLQKEVEQDNADAIHALGTLCVHRIEIDEGIALFEKGWREYEHPDCAVALAHILSTPRCDQMDLDQSWECFYGGIEKMSSQEWQNQDVRSGAIFYLRNLTTLIEEARKEKNYEQELKALDVLGKLMALSKKIDFFSQSVEDCSACAVYYSQFLSDWPAAIEAVEKAYTALGVYKKQSEIQQVQGAAQLVCNQLDKAKEKKKLSENEFKGFMNRLINLFKKIYQDNLRQVKEGK